MLKKSFFISFALTVVLFALGSGCRKSSSEYAPPPMSEEAKQAQADRNALSAKKAEYTQIPTKEQLVKVPYLDKKLVFYRFDKTKAGTGDEWQQNDFGVDKFGSSINTEANKKLEFKLAKSPEEVGIVALMPECTSVKNGTYGGKIAAYEEKCDLILVDPELAAVVYRTSFTGKLDSSKYVGGETSITAPVEGMDVVNFLDGLSSRKNTPLANSAKK